MESLTPWDQYTSQLKLSRNLSHCTGFTYISAWNLYAFVCETLGLGPLQPSRESEVLVSHVGHPRARGRRQGGAPQIA